MQLDQNAIGCVYSAPIQYSSVLVKVMAWRRDNNESRTVYCRKYMHGFVGLFILVKQVPDLNELKESHTMSVFIVHHCDRRNHYNVHSS